MVAKKESPARNGQFATVAQKIAELAELPNVRRWFEKQVWQWAEGVQQKKHTFSLPDDCDPLPLLPFKPGRYTLQEMAAVLARVHDACLAGLAEPLGFYDDEWYCLPSEYFDLICKGYSRLTAADLPRLEEFFEDVAKAACGELGLSVPSFPEQPKSGDSTKQRRQQSKVRAWDSTRMIAEIGVLRKRNPDLSIPQIAEQLGCNKTTIYRMAKKNPHVQRALTLDVAEPASSIEERKSPHTLSGRTSQSKKLDAAKLEQLKRSNGIPSPSNSLCNS